MGGPGARCCPQCINSTHRFIDPGGLSYFSHWGQRSQPLARGFLWDWVNSYKHHILSGEQWENQLDSELGNSPLQCQQVSTSRQDGQRPQAGLAGSGDTQGLYCCWVSRACWRPWGVPDDPRLEKATAVLALHPLVAWIQFLLSLSNP